MIPKSQIVNLPPYLPGKPIEDVKRELGLTEVIKLASNENPYGFSPSVRNAIIKELDTLSLYPDGASLELRAVLAKHLQVSADSLIFGNGSDEVVQLIARAYLQPGTNSVMAAPTFPMYKSNVIIEGAEVVEVPLKEGVHDLPGMLAQVNEKTRVVWICNPNNPSGTIVTKDEVVSFLDRVSDQVLVVLDEAYYEYVTDEQYPDSLSLLSKYPNIIILRTFSKIYGLAALRIGYGIANPDVIDKLNRVREPFNTSRVAQKAAIAALADQNFVKECREANRKGLEQLYGAFSALGLTYFPSQGNFILVDVKMDANVVFDGLLKQGIIVRSGKALGFPSSIRVTVGNAEQNEKFIAALKKVLL